MLKEGCCWTHFKLNLDMSYNQLNSPTTRWRTEDCILPFNFGMKHLYLPASSSVTLVIFSDMLPCVRPSVNNWVLCMYDEIFMPKSSRKSRYRWTYSTLLSLSLGSGWRSGFDHSTVRPFTFNLGCTWHGKMTSSPLAATTGWSDPTTSNWPEKKRKYLAYW